MELSRAQLLLLLLAAKGPRGHDAEPIQGTTRLQKLMFLLDMEAGLTAASGLDLGFTAWKFGPVSKELYDDLEKLENLGFVESDPVSQASSTELDEYGLSFDDLISDEEVQSRNTFEEKKYRLTEKGLNWLKKRIDITKDAAVLDRIRRVKSQYGGLSLQDLLYHVYTKYPNMTTASEIKSKVLRRKQ